MDSKAAESQGPPPSYSESTQMPSAEPITIPSNLPNPPPVRPQSNDAPPMFITARTSVYGPAPVELDCPYCQAHVVTHIDRVAGIMPWLIFGACVLLGFFLLLIPWCFCCLPFFTEQCLDVLHSCPACKRHLGRYSRV